MSSSIQTIPLMNLAIAFIPVAVGMMILIKWSLDAKNAIYAVIRMLLQLLLIGYFLAYIFGSESAVTIIVILAVMLFSSSWIALRTIAERRLSLYWHAFLSIAFGGGLTLLLITLFVLSLDPWYLPQFMIPLAGMIFANSMNAVSLAAERFHAESQRGVPYEEARNAAIQASLIPIINSLFAVGLVSLPGMMTGQILSGVSPLIAVRYQIMVMTMIFGSSVISTAIFLTLIKKNFQEK
ncbi:MAG: ABC transporter permease [Gammaproteobacteria bacterium]|nr:ABC transporter permease [Gammaproteobacteria bacterium]